MRISAFLWFVLFVGIGFPVQWLLRKIIPPEPSASLFRSLPRALAVSSANRASSMPNVPAMAETLPGFDTAIWYGMFTPTRTPGSVVTRLHGAILKALDQPETRRRLAAQGVERTGIGPDEFAGVIRADLSRWQKVITKSKIRAE